MKRGPEPIGEILAQLMARRGFTRVQSSSAFEAAWNEAAGELAEFTRLGPVRRGKLEVTVANSTMLHELSFRKRELVRTLTKLLPEEQIQDVRLRVGSLD